MAIVTTNKITVGEVQNRGIAITQGSGSKFTGVFAGIGNIGNLINVGGGGGANTGGAGGGATGGKGSIVIAGAGDDGSDVITFDPMLDEARPGDLITSDFMQRLLRRINVLEAAVLKLASGGEVVVPDLFGQQLSKVNTAVKQSGGKLKFGLVLDAVGTEVDPDEADDGARLVIGQYPVPGAEVDEGTELNLFVSIVLRTRQPGVGGAEGGFEFVRAAAAAGAATDSGELERVTDEAPAAAARGASKKARKSWATQRRARRANWNCGARGVRSECVARAEGVRRAGAGRGAMLEFGSGEQTVVRRLRIGAGGLDPLAATLRARSAFAAVNVGSAGLSPRAVLCVRSLSDPRPRSCAFDRAGLRVPQEWRERLGDELARLARAAVRPAREAVPAAAESVLFADHSELLAALGADYSRGRAIERWWWRSLLGRAPDAHAVAAAWQRWAEYAPGALELLSRTRTVAAFALSLPAHAHATILRRVVSAHALVDLSRALAPLTGEARASDVGAARRAAGDAVESDDDEDAAPPPPWHERATEAAEVGPDAARQSLVGVALMIVRAPSVVRRAEFARRVLHWSRRTAGAAAPRDDARARTPSPRDAFERRSATSDGPPRVSSLVRDPERRAAIADALRHAESAAPRRGEPERAPRPAARAAKGRRDGGGEVSATATPGENDGGRRAAPREAGEAHEGEPRSRGEEKLVGRDVLAREEAERSGGEGVAVESGAAGASCETRGEEVLPPLLEAEIETRFGGLFHLVNLGQYLGLYGDFTQPAAPGIELPLWDFVALTGRTLVGPRVERDAVWPLLARLAGRGDADEPGATFEPSDEWRAPSDWLKPFAREAGGAWRWSTSQGRQRVLHPRGFFVLDVPLEESQLNATTRTNDDAEVESQLSSDVERQLAREIEQYADFVSAAALVRAPRGLSVTWRTARARWLGHVAAYARARLRLALGAETRSRIVAKVFERRARVCVTATHIDVLMWLADLPVEVRFAGLDRDPGWVPAAGRYVAFHFD